MALPICHAAQRAEWEMFHEENLRFLPSVRHGDSFTNTGELLHAHRVSQDVPPLRARDGGRAGLSPRCPPDHQTNVPTNSTTAAGRGGRSVSVVTFNVWYWPVALTRG